MWSVAVHDDESFDDLSKTSSFQHHPGDSVSMRENIRKRPKRVVTQRKPATKSTEEGEEEETEEEEEPEEKAKEESDHPSKFVKTPKKIRQMTNEEKNEMVDKMDDRAFYQHCLTTLKENTLANCVEKEACAKLQEHSAQLQDLFST